MQPEADFGESVQEYSRQDISNESIIDQELLFFMADIRPDNNVTKRLLTSILAEGKTECAFR
jgi:hypothetical protein